APTTSVTVGSRGGIRHEKISCLQGEGRRPDGSAHPRDARQARRVSGHHVVEPLRRGRRPGSFPAPGRHSHNPIVRYFRVLGPGLVTGAADDDPSGITAYSVAGASLGPSMLW